MKSQGHMRSKNSYISCEFVENVIIKEGCAILYE